MNTISFRNRWIKHSDALPPTYSKYQNRFKYYRKDNIRYFNYFLTGSNSILEIGCGIGDTINSLKGSRKKGIGFSPKMIEYAQKSYPKLDFQFIGATQLNKEKTYDVILLSNVIACFENVLTVLNNIKKCCHQNTKAFINHYNKLWHPLIDFSEFIGIKKKLLEQNWLSKNDITNLLFLAGLDSFRSSKRLLIPIISFIFNKVLAKSFLMLNSISINKKHPY